MARDALSLNFSDLRKRLSADACASAEPQEERKTMTVPQPSPRRPKPLDAAVFQPEIGSFRLHLAAEMLGAAQEAFDRAEVGDHLFDLVQGGKGARLQAGRDLARFMLEGLARSGLTYDADERVQRLLAVIKRATHMLNRKGGEHDLWPEEPGSR